MAFIDKFLPFKGNYHSKKFNLQGKKALVITTSQATLDTIDKSTGKVLKKGGATGVYASEMTEPYYEFLDAGMDVDIASIKGGKIPIEKISLIWPSATEHDKRFKNDADMQRKVNNSIPIAAVDISKYDIIFMSGGWGAAYDLAQSEVLSDKLSQAYADKKVLGGVCHGPLGFIGAKKPDGSNLVEGVKMTAVTDKQIKQLFVGKTPLHPETELRKAGADYQSNNSSAVHMFANHVVVDEKHLIVTGQNQKGGTEAAQKALELLVKVNSQQTAASN